MGRHRDDDSLGVRLLEAACTIIDADGPKAFSLREVARRAGVSHTAPYNHFDSKDHLLAEVALLGWEKLDESMADAQHMAADDARSQFMATGMGYVLFALRHPERYRLMQWQVHCEHLDQEKQQAQSASYRRLQRAVTAMRADIGLATDDDSVNHDCLLAWSLVHGMVGLHLDAGVAPLNVDNLGMHKSMLETFTRIWDASWAQPRST